MTTEESKSLRTATRDLNNIRYALDKSAIVAIADRAGNIIHANDKFCEISKYSREELLGKNHRVINSGHHPREFFVDLWKTISHGKLWEGEIKNRAKDGTYYWVYTTIVPFIDEKGQPFEYVSIRYDITQRILAEEQRKKSEAQVIMQDRMASVGLLASGLAHEIGTPIGIIKGRAELLKFQSADQETKKTADTIIGQIDRISKLVKSLLNLARGIKVENLGAVAINQPIGEVLDLMQHEFRKNSITVKNDLPPDVRLAAMAQAEPLHQVVLNILINSVHAIEKEKKNGRSSDHFIKISAESNDQQWILNFEDSGCGISRTNMSNIFKPFFTTKDIGVGTGLGLATSYNIVESWGGSISVESQEGQGTIFKIALPKAK